MSSASEYIRFLRGLHATRTFRPEPVPREALDDILEVARWSGSASNQQPTEVVVLTDRDTMRRLSEARDKPIPHVAGAGAAILIVTRGDPEKTEHEMFDEGRLSERIMLAAKAHGLGSCIGWFAGRGVDDAKELLGVPKQRRVRTVISLGYVDEEARKARPKNPEPHKPLNAFVHWDRY